MGSAATQASEGASTGIVVWNAAWATPSGDRGRELARRIADQAPDIICLTEATTDFPLPDGHLITSSADYGYKAPAKRRKVLLWSRSPWTHVDTADDSGLPSGRFARGRTNVGFGELEVWGVCIPWSAAHVNTGRKDRVRWEDHLSYLGVLRGMLASASRGSRIVAGDYNQRVPRHRSPVRAAEALEAALGELRLATAGKHGDRGVQLIDHLAHTDDLAPSGVELLPADHGDKKLTDHVGVVLRLGRSAP
jgi:endonuclease/exonuclease/phosphatase family metal-dependent hydrolase